MFLSFVFPSKVLWQAQTALYCLVLHVKGQLGLKAAALVSYKLLLSLRKTELSCEEPFIRLRVCARGELLPNLAKDAAGKRKVLSAGCSGGS